MSNKTRRRGSKRPQSRRPIALNPPRPAPKPTPGFPPISDKIPVMAQGNGNHTMRALYKKAPRKIRFWRWLGFAEKHAARPDVPEFKDYAEGWQIVASIWLLDWKDRLRVLISGRIMCHTAIKTLPAIERFTNTAAFSVLPPGYTPGMPSRTFTREELKRATEAVKASK